MIETLSLFGDEDSDLVAHFAARTGGVSEGAYASLNLGLSTGDQRERVIENRERVARHLSCDLSKWVVLGQVHSAHVYIAAEGDAGLGTHAPAGRQADAIFLTSPGIFALSLSADCPLVALIHRKRRLAGIAHAGWRGTAAGVIENLLAAFGAEGVEPRELEAAISPAICGRCYPVGREVWDALAASPGIDRAALAAARVGDEADLGETPRRLDLRRVQLAILLRAGLASARTTLHADCSACLADRYFSHRRDRGVTGRCAALVGWR